MKRKKEQGAITIFLSIILLTVFVLTGVIVDGVRIKTGAAIAKEAAQISLYSALSEYHSPLKEDYGIFALGTTEEGLKEQLGNALGTNLKFPSDPDSLAFTMGAWNLYDFELENYSVVQQGSLMDQQVLKQAILEYMKYRAPKSLAIESLALLTELELVAETATHLETKLEIERKLDDLSLSEEKLEDAIQWFETFSTAQLVQGAESLLDYGQEIQELEEERDEIRERQRENQDNDSSAGGENDQERERLADLLREVNDHLSDTRDELADTYQNIEETIQEAIHQANTIKEEAQKLLAFISEIRIEIETFEASLDTSKGDTAALRKEIEDYQKLLQIQGLETLQQMAEDNLQQLENAQTELSSLYAQVRSADYSNSGEINRLNRQVGNFQSALRSINLEWEFSKNQVEVLSLPAGSEDLSDNRKESAEKAKEFLQADSGKEDIVIDESLVDKLPSKGAHQSEEVPEPEFEHRSTGPGYSESGLRAVKDLSGLLELEWITLRDHLYLNEYILETFQNQVFPLQNSRTAYFDYEVEYILHGATSQEKNFFMTKTQVTLLRFVMNMIYVYQTPEYSQGAQALASTLSIPFGGATAPLFKTLILGGWALNFAYEDMQELLAGESVNFYRDKEELQLDYTDYLRLLLLNPLLSETTKLARIQDLLYLNLEKRGGFSNEISLNNYYTQLQLNLEYSLKILFFQQGDTQGSFSGIQTRRYHMNLLEWQGY